MTLCFVFDRKRKTNSGQIVANPEVILMAVREDL